MANTTTAPLTFRVKCSVCSKSYQTDQKRGMVIAKLLKQNPNYLTTYKCRSCAKGTTPQTMTAPVQKAVETTLEVSKEGVKVTERVVTFSEDDILKQHIPTSAERYVNRYIGTGKGKVLDEDVLEFHFKSKDPLVKNVLFIGETGTGKTALIRYFCFKHKIPYYRVVMNGGTTVEDIIGQNVMDEKGMLKFEFQVLIQFMLKGGIFVFDEINAGQKDILHILNSITDYERKAIITQHKGEVIQAIDRFLVVACMNPPAEYDLAEMSKSLKSRFCPYYFDYDDKVDKQVLNNDSKLLDFAKAVRTARLNKQVDTPLSTRDLRQYQIIRDGLGQEVAKEMLVNKFHNGEKQVVRTMIETLLEKSNILNKNGGQ
jgi:uncharacterized protein YlaI